MCPYSTSQWIYLEDMKYVLLSINLGLIYETLAHVCEDTTKNLLYYSAFMNTVDTQI